ncbi:MAG: hypothetical protein MUE96_11635 [Bacteroidia bacterium]|jgi:hypothetical protein|nr:hypothetical protein [Bacteroidia bacterium]
MKRWYQPIVDSLPTGYRNNDLPIGTVFNASYFPQQKLFLHWVSLDPVVLKSCSTDYFSILTTTLLQQGIQCVHVWEDVHKRNPDLVVSRIAALLGIRKRIHARTGLVKRIDKPTAKLFCETNHMQGYANAYYHLGLFVKDELVAIALFSKGRNMKDEENVYRSYECVRFASLKGTTVAGGLGKLLAAFKASVHPDHVMTYVDRDWGTGSGFIKLGFSLSRTTPAEQFYWNGDERIHVRKKVENNPTHIPIYTSGNAKYTWRK